MLKQIQIGFSAYRKASKFILKNKLSWFYLMPLFLNVLLFSAIIYGTDFITEGITNWCLEYFGLEKGGEYYETVGVIIWWFFYVILKLISWIIFHFVSGGLILIILSPVLAYLSERTEKILKGNEYPFNLNLFIKDVARGAIIAARNTILQLIIMVLIILLALIPLVQFVTPFLLFIVAAYYYGFSFMDYTCERRRLTLKESVRFMRNNKGLTLANGSIFAGAIMIPWVGGLLAGFVAINSVVAATISVYEAEDKNLLK